MVIPRICGSALDKSPVRTCFKLCVRWGYNRGVRLFEADTARRKQLALTGNERINTARCLCVTVCFCGNFSPAVAVIKCTLTENISCIGRAAVRRFFVIIGRCIFYARMRQKGVSGEAPLSEVSAAADSLMSDVRIAIRRTSLCAPTGGSHILPRMGLPRAAFAASAAVIAAAFSQSNYANSAGICCAVFSAERCPPIPFCIIFCTEKI